MLVTHNVGTWRGRGTPRSTLPSQPAIRRAAPTIVPHATATAAQGHGQKDVTAELLERVFGLALTTRLKQYQGIDVDVRSTALGLMEGRFGGLTVRGQRWRTPLELTAELLMVDVGELVIDYPKLVFQQQVTLRNVPQGLVSFTLTSADLANFMAHPIMKTAATKAVQGHAFLFDRSTASVSLDPTTGRGIVNYHGVWAGNGQRYDVTMTTPPAGTASSPANSSSAAAAAAAATTARATPPGARPPASATPPAGPGSNTLEQLTVVARRIVPSSNDQQGAGGTGSFASAGSSRDDSRDAAAAAAAAAAANTALRASAAAAFARFGPPSAFAPSPATRSPSPPPPPPPPPRAPSPPQLSYASVASVDGEGPVYDMEDPSNQVVGEGLRRFFSSLIINLQGIELRQPTLLVQLPGPGNTAGGAGVARFTAPGPRPAHATAAAAPAAPARPGTAASPLPALLTISMKVAILQLPPMNMKF